MLRNAGRGRGGADDSRPSALLSTALRRAADERAALRAASPDGPSPVIVIERVDDAEPAPLPEPAPSLEELRLREEAERALREAAEQRAQAERDAAEVARLRAEAEERATLLAREREETERSAAREAQDRAAAEREATQAVQERLRLERSAQAQRARHQADEEGRRLRRNLLLALFALVAVGGAIVGRAFMPGGYFAEPQTAPTFQLDRELKSTAPNPK